MLCHPKLGPIDVMPDHPHEGLCFTESQIDLAATYAFNGYSGPEYPGSGSGQPRPRVIAWGHTLADPPYSFAKGDTTAKHFPMISVYDGHIADVEGMLRGAGFENVRMDLKSNSDALVQGWSPGAETLVASALIRATKPRAAGSQG